MGTATADDRRYLQWVLVSGERVHVSRFADLRPADRPPATCPVCDEPVTMKLGTQVVHHAAHRPHSDCAVAGGGETVLHYNAKCHVAAVVGRLDALEIEHECNDCAKPVNLIYAVGWDAVAVEKYVESRQPDVLLLDDDQPILGVEVRVSNAVSDEKADALAKIGLRWVEVDAVAALRWDATGPLPVLDTDAPWPTCRACEARYAANIERNKLDHANRLATTHYRLVDVCWDSGRRVRQCYEIRVQHADGEPVSVSLVTWRREPATAEQLVQEAMPPSKESMETIKTAFIDEVARWERQEALVVMATAWRPWTKRCEMMNPCFDIEAPPWSRAWSAYNKRWYEPDDYRKWRESR